MADEKQHSATVDVETDVKPVEKPKQGHEADEAFNAIEELQGEAIDLDSGTNKRLLKIIDWHLMPIMCFVYGMNYLDSMFAFHSAPRIMCTNDGRNNTLLRQYHGYQDGYQPKRGPVSMAGQFILLWLSCLRIPYQYPPPTPPLG